MNAKTRIQFSIPIHRVARVNMTGNLPQALVPFLWIEEVNEKSEYSLHLTRVFLSGNRAK